MPSIFIDDTAPQSLLDIITNAGLTANLKLCLDAGDSGSYPGTGQSWLDRSGNGHDFFLGADGSATSTDPTFNGTAGGLSSSEYFSVDGGDYFRYDSANETWMQNLHKDGALFSLVAMIYAVTGAASSSAVLGTAGNALGAGMELRLAGVDSYQPRFIIYNAITGALDAQASGSLSTNAWNMVGLAVNESGGSVSFHYLNGNYNQVSGSNTFNATYNSPASGNANYTLEIGAVGNGQIPMQGGFRIGGIAVWDTALSKANVDAVWNSWRVRYGI